jgi:phospho-N-acetylmuramoyl-pentapeptide-transferase
MIYHVAAFLQHFFSPLNVVHYVSVRMMAAFLATFCMSLLWGERFITTSRRYFKSGLREHLPNTHAVKEGMPTMGGLFIIAVVFCAVLLLCRWSLYEVWIVLATFIGFGVIGFWDDYTKITKGRGISEKKKLYAQWFIALISASTWYFISNPSTALCIPLVKNCAPDLGPLFILWAAFILVATSNAVNLTDGLDGLAIGSLIINFATFSVIAYLAGHHLFAHYLHIPYAGTAEIAIFAAALVGASCGFLWYNAYPAQIFMGDVGSLSLGAALGSIALMTKQELLLAITGGLFVLETLSVIVQVFSYKMWKVRVFRMAPFHHHLELRGWPESKIAVRFALITVVLCLISLMSLKIR